MAISLPVESAEIDLSAAGDMSAVRRVGKRLLVTQLSAQKASRSDKLRCNLDRWSHGRLTGHAAQRLAIGSSTRFIK
jgi:hypothetical protein